MAPITLPDDATAEDAWNALRPLIRRDYRQWIDREAESILSDHPGAQEVGDLDDAIHESADGSYWVTYTSASLMVLTVSDNDLAFVDEFGGEALVDRPHNQAPTASMLYARLAYGAVEADLTERLAARLEDRRREADDEPEDPAA